MLRHSSILAHCLLPISVLIVPAGFVACGGSEDFGTPDGGASASGGATSTGGGTGTTTGGTSATGGKTGSGGTSSTAGGGPSTGGASTGGIPNKNEPTEYTFQTSKVPVAPGAEVFKCQDFPNPFGKDIGIIEMETELTPGSHHMFAFVVSPAEATLTGSIADCPSGGVEFHEYLTTNGTPKATTVYPDGVGRVFSGGAALRLNVHFINTSADSKDAFVTFKVKYVDPATLENRAAAIFLNNVGVRVPPGKSTATRTYTLTEDIELLGAASHMHKQGIHFVATTNTGQTLYDGTEWAEPKPKSYSPALHLAAGTVITWACTYQNDTSKTLGFGESAATNEMCIFPGEFYNKTGAQISYQAFR